MHLFGQYKIAPKLAVPEQYRLYRIYEGELIDLGRCVPETTNVTYGNSGSYFYFIRDGKLYQRSSSEVSYIATMQVGTDSGWTAVSGIFAIKDGALYVIIGAGYATPVTQLGTDTGWTQIVAYTGEIGFGINNGSLYIIEKVVGWSSWNLVQLDSNTDWTTLGELYYDGSVNGHILAIRAGMLYSASYVYGTGTSLTQPWGTDTGWTAATKLDGDSSGYGIRNGALYRLTSVATQIGTDTSWTAVAGYSWGVMGLHTGAHCGCGINNGKLYMLSFGDATQIGTDTGWTAISGNYFNTNYLGLGIRDGKLYKINGYPPAEVTQFGGNSGWLAIEGENNSGLAIRRVA